MLYHLFRTVLALPFVEMCLLLKQLWREQIQIRLYKFKFKFKFDIVCRLLYCDWVTLSRLTKLI